MKKMSFTDKIICIVTFAQGTGTKLLQSQFDKHPNIYQIPGYPLKYFYPNWFLWKKKYDLNDVKKILNLIVKNHESILDSRKIKGFSGLTYLGKNKRDFLKLDKKKFKEKFFFFLKNKKINSKNILLAIHNSIFSIKKQKSKSKYLLYHIHSTEYYFKYLKKDFPKSKLILCIRNPINHFWKRVKVDTRIEKKRFDKTDQIILKAFNYNSRLINIFYAFKYMIKNNKNIYVKFEDLKDDNLNLMKKLCSNLKIKFSKKNISPSADGKTWWNDPVYVVKKNSESVNDLNKNFFKYEIFNIEYSLDKFYKTFHYKKIYPIKNKFLNILIFYISIFFPTKNGLKNFIFFINPLNLVTYNIALYEEIFLKKIKNYYFNAMYKFKPEYYHIKILKFNILRRKIFLNRFKNKNFFFSFISFLYFIFKNIYYLLIPIILLYLYLIRIFTMIYFRNFIKYKVKF